MGDLREQVELRDQQGIVELQDLQIEQFRHRGAQLTLRVDDEQGALVQSNLT
jgi:hypothetical protein